MTTFTIILSIWYLIGLFTGIAAMYHDWRHGHDIRLNHIPLILLGACLGVALTFMLWGEELLDSLHDIGDKVLIPGRRKP